MKKNSKIFLNIFTIILFALVLIACNKTVTITEEVLENLVFKNESFEYNGTKHSIYVENEYEKDGVTIKYKNNEKVDPGVYFVIATIEYNDLKVIKQAIMTIEKQKSILEAPSVQSALFTDKNIKLQYTLNNKEQKIIILDENGQKIDLNNITNEGIYLLEVYAEENGYYLESNHINIEFNLYRSLFDIEFNSKEVIANGEEQKIEIEGKLPEGFTVEYKNNTGTEDGIYFAEANIKNEKNEIVETQYAVLKIDNPENPEFKKFLDDFFIEYLEGDQLTVNIFCENPENFGLTNYDAKWYTFDPNVDEDIEDDIKYFEEYLEKLKKFESEKLSDLQEVAYETIYEFLNYYIEYYQIKDVDYMNLIYIDQFGGYVADFGTYMESYSLRTKNDVENIVKYINSTLDAFPSYLQFIELKKQKGFALSDYTIEEMRGYLEDVLEQGEDYYLGDIINNKIDKVTFLTNEEKTVYKNQIKEAIKVSFIPGVKELYDGLSNYIGVVTVEEEGYWATYENGKELFKLELEKLLGINDINIDEYIKELDLALSSSISKVISAQSTIVNNFQITTWEELEALVNEVIIFDGTPDEMIVYLKEFAKNIVPDLKTDPEITIKEMDMASASVSNAVAYYMKSALDNTSNEYITLNPIQLKDSSSNDVLTTLAHEGYPGHLYAYLYSKETNLSNISKIMTSTAHGEGWATYVELALYEYAIANAKDNKSKAVLQYLYSNQLSGFLLETRLDAGIHLEGWNVEDVANYMTEIGYVADGAQDIYNLLIEMPTQYAAYGYGKLFFYNLHEEAKTILGKSYDEVEFNAMLISNGWTSLDILRETYEQYMQIKCYELSIQYN